MMEINEIRSHLERSSKRAGLLTMIGVAFGIAALVFSFYYLNKQYERLETVKKEIQDKEARVADLDKALEEKQQKLDETEKTFANYQDYVKTEDPVAANDAITKTIENNPMANQVLLDVTSKTASPGTIPPPKGARVAFCPKDDVRIRDNPDLNANVIDKLRKGQTIYVMNFSQNSSEWREMKGRWAHIQTEKGLQGWVFEPYIAFGPKQETPVTPVPQPPVVRDPIPGRPVKPVVNGPIVRPTRLGGNRPQ